MDQNYNHAKWPGTGENPRPPHIKQRFVLCGAHSKMSHTNCFMALSHQATREVDSVLEIIFRNIWSLPPIFPKAGLHALLEDLGLNISSVWEDYCGAAIRLWT
jgi:hypothetical protein